MQPFEIYADVVFFINFFMDLFILWIVFILNRPQSNKKFSVVRLVLGAFSMSLLYCLLIFISSFRLYLNIFASVVIIMVGIIIAFSPDNVKTFIKLVGLSHIVAFSLGGLGIAIFYYTNITDLISNIGGVGVHNFSLKILLTSTCCFYMLFKIFNKYIRHRIIRTKTFYQIKIFYENTDVDICALVDTGNSLHDPISKNPVIVAEFNSIKDFLPDGVKLIFYEKKENDFSILSTCLINSDFYGRIRMIPFSSLGKQNGMLLGFRPDKIEVINGKNIATFNNVIIGIYNFKLSNSGDYQGLMNPELIQ